MSRFSIPFIYHCHWNRTDEALTTMWEDFLNEKRLYADFSLKFMLFSLIKSLKLLDTVCYITIYYFYDTLILVDFTVILASLGCMCLIYIHTIKIWRWTYLSIYMYISPHKLQNAKRCQKYQMIQGLPLSFKLSIS